MNEDETESSIYDLVHAPPPPSVRPTTTLGSSLSSSMEFKSSYSVLGGRSWNRLTEDFKNLGEDATARRQRRASAGAGGSVNSYSSHTSQSAHHALDLSNRSWNRQSEDTGTIRERRASTGDGSVASSSSTQSAHSPLHLSHVKSFPPSERNERKPASGNKKVGFDFSDASPYGYGDDNLLGLPEVVTEVDESEDIYGYGNQDQDRDTDLIKEERQESFTRGRTDSVNSMFSASGASENTSEEEEFKEEDDIEIGNLGSKPPVIFWGLELPRCFSHRPSWTRMAYFVVTRAPCFWGCGFRSQIAPTDKAILGRLNVLVAFFSAGQVGSALFLFCVMFLPNLVDREVTPQSDKESENGGSGIEILVNIWNINTHVYALGVLASVNLFASIMTIRVIRNVNLVGAIRYLWLLLWMIPFQIYFLIGLFDYFRVTDVWIKHWWRADSMAWFREVFCAPGTANTRCAVPASEDTTSEVSWCLTNYGKIDCLALRTDAQSEMEKWMLPFYYFNASWGIFTIILMLLVTNTLESIISKPLVQKSKESNVPFWLALPMIGCVVMGSVLAFAASSVLSTNSESEVSWIGPVYLLTAGLFLVGALTGWFIKAFSILSVQQKRQKLAAVLIFIIAMGATLAALVSIFAASIAFSVNLVNVPIDTETRENIACFLDQADSCSRCEDEFNRCPEWSESDVTGVLQTQAKSSAALAAIFVVHAFSALRFGFGLRKHIIMYQIDYV